MNLLTEKIDLLCISVIPKYIEYKEFLAKYNITQKEIERIYNRDYAKIMRTIKNVVKTFVGDKDIVDIISNDFIDNILKTVFRINVYTFKGQYIKKKSQRIFNFMLKNDLKKLLNPENKELEFMVSRSFEEIKKIFMKEILIPI